MQPQSRRGNTVERPTSLFGAQVAASEPSQVAPKVKKSRKIQYPAVPADCGCKGTPPVVGAVDSRSHSHSSSGSSSSSLPPGPPTGGVEFCEPPCTKCPDPILPVCKYPAPPGKCPPRHEESSVSEKSCLPFYDPARWCVPPKCPPKPPKPDPCQPPVWTPNSKCKINTGCGWMHASLVKSAVVRKKDGTDCCRPPVCGEKLPLYYEEVDDVITYTYTIVNDGQVELEFPVFLIDSKLGGTIFNAVHIYPGTSVSYHLCYTVTECDIKAKQICNRAIAYLKVSQGCEDDLFLCTNEANLCVNYGNAKIGVCVGRAVDNIPSGEEWIRVALYNEGTTAANISPSSVVKFSDFGYSVEVTSQSASWETTAVGGPSGPSSTTAGGISFAATGPAIIVPAGGALVYEFRVVKTPRPVPAGSVLKVSATVAIDQYDGDGSANNVSAYCVIVN